MPTSLPHRGWDTRRDDGPVDGKGDRRPAALNPFSGGTGPSEVEIRCLTLHFARVRPPWALSAVPRTTTGTHVFCAHKDGQQAEAVPRPGAPTARRRPIQREAL